MKRRLEMFVPGKAVPQGSKIRNRWGGVRDQAEPRLTPWREQVRAAAEKHFEGPVILGPVRLSLTFFREAPSSRFTARGLLSTDGAKLRKRLAPAMAPDLGKVARAVQDALTGTVYKDDSLVVWEENRKVWGRRDGVAIVVDELEYPADAARLMRGYVDPDLFPPTVEENRRWMEAADGG